MNNSGMNSFSDFEFELLSFQLRISAGEYAEQLTDGRQRSQWCDPAKKIDS